MGSCLLHFQVQIHLDMSILEVHKSAVFCMHYCTVSHTQHRGFTTYGHSNAKS